jgi:hypothetical protein
VSNVWTRRDEEAWQDWLRRRSDVITPLSSGPSLSTAQRPKPVIEREVGDDAYAENQGGLIACFHYFTVRIPYLSMILINL